MDPPGPSQAPWISPATSITTLFEGRTDTVTFDVTADVRAFVAGTASNDGWLAEGDARRRGPRDLRLAGEREEALSSSSSSTRDRRGARRARRRAGRDRREPDVFDATQRRMCSTPGPTCSTRARPAQTPRPTRAPTRGGRCWQGAGGREAAEPTPATRASWPTPAQTPDRRASRPTATTSGLAPRTRAWRASASTRRCRPGAPAAATSAKASRRATLPALCQPGLPPDLHDSDGCTSTRAASRPGSPTPRSPAAAPHRALGGGSDRGDRLRQRDQLPLHGSWCTATKQ